MPSTSTNSWTAALISLPPSSTTCAPSSRYTRGRHDSSPAWRVISGTITCACTSKVIRLALDRDQGQDAADNQEPAQPHPRIGLLQVPADHDRSQHQRD